MPHQVRYLQSMHPIVHSECVHFVRCDTIKDVREDVVDHLDNMRVQEAASVLRLDTKRSLIGIPTGPALAVRFEKLHQIKFVHRARCFGDSHVCTRQKCLLASAETVALNVSSE